MFSRSAQVIRQNKTSSISLCTRSAAPNNIRTQQRRRQQQQQQRNYFNEKNEHIRPYSDSLPSPGYEWCARCQIRTHRFQKPQGRHNACLDAPRLFGLGICSPARQYYQNQVTHMIFLSLFCFAAAPLYNNATTHAQEEGEDDDA